ncbi:glucosamine-6-phosphate deaminase [Treponema sp. OttesenSCG-928-L16]|nr:glucosamine-6-phosphate deaminase [Treponema sp. OttesenSCG-928-L16]
MRLFVCEDKSDLGRHAAAIGASRLRQALREKARVSIILATGASQFEMLTFLVEEPGIDWSRIEVFHLDEYVGIPITHKASFRKYLKERFAEKLPSLGAFHCIEGDASDTEAELRRISSLIESREIDLAFIGIGENGHLAFNDPPADLKTSAPYIIVELDRACRMQQVGEGWFSSIDEVPPKAISMSIPQILKSRCIVCTVPDKRKAVAVEMALYDPADPMHPAASLRGHSDTYLLTDKAAAEKVLVRN